MPISILDLSRKPEGTTVTRAIHIDTLEDIDLARPIEAQADITTLTPQIFTACLATSVFLRRICDRCAKAYDYELPIRLTVTFADDEADGEWPIVNNTIDFTLPVREEILLNLPLRSLCSPDCKGVTFKHQSNTGV